MGTLATPGIPTPRRLAHIISALVAAVSAIAAPWPCEADHTWGIEVLGGASTYALEAVNDSLASLDRNLGTSFGSIDGGGALGAAIRYWSETDLLFRLSVEKDWAVATDADRTFDIGTLGVSFGGTYFPYRRGVVRLGLGLSAGGVWIRGAFSGSGFGLDARGGGGDFRATAEALFSFATRGFVGVSVGGRFSRVIKVTLADQRLGARADFSGLILRVAAGLDGWPRSDSP